MKKFLALPKRLALVAFLSLPVLFSVSGCDDSKPAPPINVARMERDCPNGIWWDNVHEKYISTNIKACLGNLSSCQSNPDDLIPLSAASTCDPNIVSSGNNGNTPPNGGTQTQRKINISIEITNLSPNTQNYSIPNELAYPNAGPHYMLSTITTQNPKGAIINLGTKPASTVTINNKTISWYNNGVVLPLPVKNNECGVPVIGSFMRRVKRITNNLRQVRYTYSLGEDGLGWGNYLVTSNPPTKKYNASYSDGALNDYHVSIIALDAYTAIEEIDSSSSTPQCAERNVVSLDINSGIFPYNADVNTVAFASEDFMYGNTQMHSHPLVVDMTQLGLLQQSCPATSFKDIFEYLTSHEMGHFLLDAHGHRVESDHLMSQQFSCKAVAEKFETLPYLSGTVPPAPDQLSKFGKEQSLETYCQQYPRYCKDITQPTEQPAKISYPTEQYILRWVP